MVASLTEKVKKYILDHHLIEQGEGVVVGISGGPDSLCLAHILLLLRESMGFEICLAHLNHSLRGEESEADMDFVSRLSREWDVTAIFETVDIYNYIFKKRVNLEEAARILRYNFFVKAAFQFNGNKVAVGHTADDQVETVLMHLLRGSGTRGVRGMSPYLNWTGKTGMIKVIRPLLDIWRKDTEEYCKINGLEYHIDSSNVNLAFLRNRLRLELVPYLQNINKRAKESILRLARITVEEADYLDGEAERLSGETILESKPALSGLSDSVPESLSKFTVLFLKTDKILSCHPAIQRLLFLKALEKMYGSTRDLESHHVERLRSASGLKAGTRVTLPDGLLFLKDYEGGWLCHNEEEVCPFPIIEGEQEIPVEGEISYRKWTIKTRRLESFDTSHFKNPALDFRFRTPATILPPPYYGSMVFHAILSLDRVQGNLKVRNKRDGDRFQPSGMEGTRKLQDFMTDEKIPRWWREHIPLICAGEDTLWVAGWRISELTRVREGDEKIIEIEMRIT